LVSYYEKKGSCSKVIKTLRASKQHFKPFPKSLMQKEGACLMKLKRFGEAITIYKSLQAKAKKDWKSYHNLAVAYDAAGSPKIAVKNFKKALTLDPPELEANRIRDRVGFGKKKKRKK
jgi:Flp pilus assembly protein TadD